jgi:hypothetical protein
VEHVLSLYFLETKAKPAAPERWRATRERNLCRSADVSLATDMDDKTINLWRQINGLSSRRRKPGLSGAGEPGAATTIPSPERPRP